MKINTYSYSMGSLVDIVTVYELDSWSSIPNEGKSFFSASQCPDRLWDPLSLLSNGYQSLFPWKGSSWDVKLTTHFHLVAK
jgi:hypothetical protein